MHKTYFIIYSSPEAKEEKAMTRLLWEGGVFFVGMI
jgi:hypothetical protein